MTGEPVDSAGFLVALLRAATLEFKFKKQIHPNKIKVNKVINYIYKLLHPQQSVKQWQLKYKQINTLNKQLNYPR